MATRSLPDKYYGENGIHRVPLWRIAGFALNNTATNMYMLLMNFVAYYFQGFLGIATVTASSIAMIMRIWDGVTDPFIGMCVDRTDGKFGKNRPFMIIGQIILCVTSFIMFHLVVLLPEGVRFPVFLVVEALYYIGYTFQCVVTKSAQTALTNDPKQRPLFSMFDGVYNTLLFSVVANVVFTNIATSHENGFFDQATWNDMWLVTAIVAAVFTAIAVISIWPKDRTEFFGTCKKAEKVGLKDYWNTIKGNKALQMLIISASSDKLASTMKTSTITIMLFAVLAGNYKINASGPILFSTFAGAAICMLCVGGLATALGQRKAMLYGSWAGIALNAGMILLWTFGDPTSMSVNGEIQLNYFMIIYVVLAILIAGAQGVSGNIVIPMTADCADYEVYRTGKYVPGMMGTIFSLVDKLISSFAPFITGVLLSAIGFSTTMPNSSTTLSDIVANGGVYEGQVINIGMVKPVTLFCAYGMLIVGLLCNVIALKFYPLTKEYMESIQEKIAEIKAKAAE